MSASRQRVTLCVRRLTALGTLDDVGRRQTLVQGRGNLQPLQGEHLRRSLP